MIKRSISVLLAVVMIISVITTLPFTANAQEIEITAEGANVELTETGYADLDGSISIIDATYIQRWLASMPTNDKIGKPIS